MKLTLQKMRVFKNILIRHPILTIFDVTKLCNERCPMCNIWKTSSDDMTLQQIEKRANHLERFGIGYVFLQGGDPLMRNDIIKIIDIFLKHGIRPTVITNGIRLTPEIAEAIAKRPCNLAISIDSLLPGRYQKLRGVDALAKVMENIERISYLQGKHKGNWSITTTVTKLTELSDVINMMNYANQHGFMYAIRPYITVSGTAGRKDAKLIYDYHDVLAIFDFILERAYKENLFAAMIYEEHIKYIKGEKMPPCDAMKYSFLMKETGQIAPCIEFPALKVSLKDFANCKKRYGQTLTQCNCTTPCFYNDAREIGFLWRKRWRLLLKLPQLIIQMKRYGNFF